MSSYRPVTRTNSQRKKLYKWAWGLKGKGQVSKIGKVMKTLGKSKPKGYKYALNGLSSIGERKKGYAAGIKSCSKRTKRY